MVAARDRLVAGGLSPPGPPAAPLRLRRGSPLRRRLEVLKSTAEALINTQALRPLLRMPDSVIAELEHAFFGSGG